METPLQTNELARRLNVDARQIVEWAEAGLLPSLKDRAGRGSSRLYRQEAIERGQMLCRLKTAGIKTHAIRKLVPTIDAALSGELSLSVPYPVQVGNHLFALWYKPRQGLVLVQRVSQEPVVISLLTVSEFTPPGQDRVTMRTGNTSLRRRSPGGLGSFWNASAEYPTLDSLAELHPGLPLSTSGTVSDQEQEGFAPGMYLFDDTLESYVAARLFYADIRREIAQGDALSHLWEQPKALVSTAPTSAEPWCLLATVDTEGLHASQHYIGVWPRENDAPVVTAEVLTAVLNSPLANAFIYREGSGRDNDKNVLEKIPVPSFTEGQVREITALVNAYVDLRWEYIDEPGKWTGELARRGRRALLKIDAAVLDAYALPPDLEAALLRQFDGLERTHLPFSFTGYDPEEWADAKAELADDREAQRIADAFFALLKKRNLSGLTDREQEEYDRLQDLRTERRTQYRALIASGK